MYRVFLIMTNQRVKIVVGGPWKTTKNVYKKSRDGKI